jgi:hypothetical protein
MKHITKFEIFNEGVNFFEKGKLWSIDVKGKTKKVKVVGSIPQNQQVLKLQEIDDSGENLGSVFVGKKSDVKVFKEITQPKETGNLELSVEEKQENQKSLEEIKKTKPTIINISGHFSRIKAFRPTLISQLYLKLSKHYKQNKLEEADNVLMNILKIETELGRLISASMKPSNKDTDLWNRIHGADPFTAATENMRISLCKVAKEKYGKLIEDKLSIVDSEINKLNVEKTTEPESEKKSTESETNTDVSKRYNELIKSWKENQKKIGKNTSPGEGTRKRLMKQAESEVNFDETTDVDADLKSLKNRPAFDAVDRISSLIRAKKIKNTNNILRYLDFSKSKIETGNVGKISPN